MKPKAPKKKDIKPSAKSGGVREQDGLSLVITKESFNDAIGVFIKYTGNLPHESNIVYEFVRENNLIQYTYGYLKRFFESNNEYKVTLFNNSDKDK